MGAFSKRVDRACFTKFVLAELPHPLPPPSRAGGGLALRRFFHNAAGGNDRPCRVCALRTPSLTLRTRGREFHLSSIKDFMRFLGA